MSVWFKASVYPKSKRVCGTLKARALVNIRLGLPRSLLDTDVGQPEVVVRNFNFTDH